MIEEFKDLKEIQMIIFRLANEEYTIPIMNVQEIIMPQPPTHIPKAPGWVEGILNLRGHIIPIIDGKKKFQIENKEQNKADSRIIVIDVDHEMVGLNVQELSDDIHLKTEDINPTPVDIGEDNEFLWGVGKYQNKLLILINPQKFLSHSETHDLKKFSKVTENIQQATKVCNMSVCSG